MASESSMDLFFTGSSAFIEELKKRTFKDGCEVTLKIPPERLTAQYLIDHGFTSPIVLNSVEGLDLVVPPFDNLSDLEEFVGADTEVEVIDVELQDHLNLEFSSFVRYMKKPKRHKVLNLISLECSTNGLNSLMEPPLVARELDWTTQYWPPDEEDERPKVQKYCLISPKNSYTDFHIDFGGTSVWYHVVKGEKNFYVIRPTEANTSLFWNWSKSRNRLHTFFGDQVDECFKLRLRAGQTLFLPTGWIHAVLTAEDSLVYGGNFLHSLSIEEQLNIYAMETKYKTPMKYKFPHFEDLHWLAGQGLLHELEKFNRKQAPAPKYLLNGLKVISHYLRQWLPNKRMFFEDANDANNLLKEISKQLRISERLIQTLNPPKPERGSTRTRKRPVYEDFIDYSVSKKQKSPKKSDSEDGVGGGGPEEGRKAEPAVAEVNWHILNGGLKLMLKRGNSEDLTSPTTSSGLSSERQSTHVLAPVDYTMREEIVPSEKSPREAGSLRITLPTTGTSTSDSQAKVYDLNVGMAGRASAAPPPPQPTTSSKSLLSPKKPKQLYQEETTQLGSHVVHQDDDYIYPSLELTDEDIEEGLPTPGEKEDEAWSPKAKVGKVLPRPDRPSRLGKQKIAVEKGLEAAASTPSSSKFIKNYSQVQAQKKTKKVKTTPMLKGSGPLPKGGSMLFKGSSLLQIKPSASAPSPTTPKSNPKPKKGLATPKQRLGKILKLHKIRH